MNSRFSGSMGYQRLIKEIKRDTGGGGGGPPGPDSVGTSQIINASVAKEDLSTQLQDFIDNTKTLLSVSKINLIINNLASSHKPFNYEITFTDENSNVTNYFTSAVGINHGSSQSVLLSIASNLLTTNITIAIDTGSIIVDEYGIGSGATEVDYNVEVGTTRLTFTSDGSPNIEIGFKVLND
jgi:hypothetical protein